MEILLDASAIMAVIADEPESEIVITHTKDAVIVSPTVLPAGKSPLEDIPRMKLDITTEEIVALLRECRAGT
ncbi:MAG: hypothetical protein LBT33_00830 [Spirochaetia bacterium]|jgi:uncharacterized protein with PIN domain|nr:hypothetical protein [Spirochaetia bacterium]